MVAHVAQDNGKQGKGEKKQFLITSPENVSGARAIFTVCPAPAPIPPTITPHPAPVSLRSTPPQLESCAEWGRPGGGESRSGRQRERHRERQAQRHRDTDRETGRKRQREADKERDRKQREAWKLYAHGTSESASIRQRVDGKQRPSTSRRKTIKKEVSLQIPQHLTSPKKKSRERAVFFE